MAEPKFKWKSWDLISDDRGFWWWEKPTTRLVTVKYNDPSNPGLEYETQLSHEGDTTTIARHTTYADALIKHKWYTTTYGLKKR